MLSISLVFANPTILDVKYKKIIVHGKTVVVDTIEQSDGTWGYYAYPDQAYFDVIVKNQLKESTVIHWHGLLLPNSQDGVELTQKLIKPGGEYHYKFKIQQTGTYWMHSHAGFQEQQLAEAPLILEDKSYDDMEQIPIMFQDFSFKTPESIFYGLRHSNDKMDMTNMDMSQMKPDLNDVNYDAFLTNYHELSNPEVVQVASGKRVKLRFMNGGASSNFWINLGKLNGEAVAVDGKPINPMKNHLFQLAIGQRMDIIVRIPANGGIFPILGQVEGTKFQTGLILTTSANSKLPHISEQAESMFPALNYGQELMLTSTLPFINKQVNDVINIDLTGDMQKYIWMINKQIWPNVKPIMIKKGDRVEMVIHNNTMMSHPMHLHGYVFKVEEINGKKLANGALRDTVLVQPNSTVRIVFDADIAGKWFMHCHMLYHMHAGMMTFIDVQ